MRCPSGEWTIRLHYHVEDVSLYHKQSILEMLYRWHIKYAVQSILVYVNQLLLHQMNFSTLAQMCHVALSWKLMSYRWDKG
jgi:hypothetical protein